VTFNIQTLVTFYTLCKPKQGFTPHASNHIHTIRISNMPPINMVARYDEWLELNQPKIHIFMNVHDIYLQWVSIFKLFSTFLKLATLESQSMLNWILSLWFMGLTKFDWIYCTSHTCPVSFNIQNLGLFPKVWKSNWPQSKPPASNHIRNM
jgi:hypothetical protein